MTDEPSLPDIQPEKNPVDNATQLTVDCLEFSFLLLREIRPSLALIIQNLLAESRHYGDVNTGAKLITLNLDSQIVSDIVTALSGVAEHAASNDGSNKEQMVAIHQTLLDWLLYAQSFLDDFSSPKQKE
ncbi:MAG: hypothetical protein V7459_14340 [Oceanicoccus sp.]